jgi:type VI secretion system protein ImpB
MANDREVSTAPKERVNIRYRTTLNGEAEDVELPLRILMLGDFTGAPDDRPIDERKPIDINKDNFADVMKAQNLRAELEVPDHLAPDKDGSKTMSVSLSFNSLNDFRPEGIVQNVERLREIQELRDALKQLKDPLGNVPNFLKRIQAVLKDPDKRKQLMDELGIEEDGS